MPTFTVDTKLFQELGELLVAKESTALVELIKNAYDADATVVRVHGVSLDDPENGRIVVGDDGSGMTEDEFRQGFLRIASRTKLTADRRSAVFGRRFTGEKGIGRLAAHKLATKVVVRSRKAQPTPRGAGSLTPAVAGILAKIDWAKIEALETLDQIEGSDAVTLETRRPIGWAKRRAGKAAPTFTPGTTLTLSPLRKRWTPRMIDSFLKEAVTLAPSPVLWAELPEGMVAEELLFKTVPVRDQGSADPGFRIEFSGELAVPDLVTPDVAEAASWVAELEHDRETGRLRVALAPTRVGLRKAPGAEGYRFEKRLPPGSGPSFRARIFQRSNETWPPPVQGIRVFMEGFRVPPYGDVTDDWLGLERVYKSRAGRQLASLSQLEDTDMPPGLPTEELSVQGNAAYMGAVFLHRSSSPDLEMLVNREGFVPSEGLDFVAEWLRITTDLIVRLGYAARQEVREVRQEDRERQRVAAFEADVAETPSALRVRQSAQAVQQNFDTVRAAIRAGDYAKAASAASAAAPHIEDVTALSNEFGIEAVRWRVLASLGTELAAFVHEIRALAREAGDIVEELDHALEAGPSGGVRSRVQRARKAALALADRIRRNATYLVDSTSFAGRRRRSRLPLRQRFETVLPFFESRLAQRRIVVENEIPEDLRSPPMFPSELTGIFTNLVSNAVKFANEGGRILAHAAIDSNVMLVTVENTGVAVELKGAQKLFEAFHSTTERPDAVLGQGMGLGLTITRAFVQEYGGTIKFVRPRHGFDTAIQFAIPAR